MTAISEEALAAFRRCSGLADPVPDYFEPEFRAAVLRDIRDWYEGREGDGPWCWKCGKPAVFQRRGLLDGPSQWCRECSKIPGCFYPIEAGGGAAWHRS